MRYLILVILLLYLAVIPEVCAAENSAVLVVVDSLGSPYINPAREATYREGAAISTPDLNFFREADIRYELQVPLPDTETGHAVIVTGYSGATGETLTYYDATIFDCLRKQGYWNIGIMETGDTGAMIEELDCGVFERNNSAVSPCLTYVKNNDNIPDELIEILSVDPLTPVEPGKDLPALYHRYDLWPLETAQRLIRYMNQSHPGQKYFLIVNIAGIDSVGHNRGCDDYLKAVRGIDPGLSAMVLTCEEHAIPVVITADHGMSFKNEKARGAHFSGEASKSNESLIVPLLIFADPVSYQASAIYGQECIAPTLLGLMGCQNTLSMSDVEPVDTGHRPFLFILSKKELPVTVGRNGVENSYTVNGTLKVGPLDQGIYAIRSGARSQSITLMHDTTVEIGETQNVPTSIGIPTAVLACLFSATGIAVALRVLGRRG